jgi:arylsulfatase A-like enzyme
MKNFSLRFRFVVCGLLLATGLSAQPLNLVFILADDLGWSDTSLYGTTELYETPNLQRLAARGMTFTRAYSNSPLCSPTRASILTGQTPARHGSTQPQHHTAAVRLTPSVRPAGNPGDKSLWVNSVSRLDTQFPTLGKLAKQAGWQTGHFGKWHLGPEPYSPLQHGFDVDVPHHPGPGPAGSYVAPWRFKNFKAKTPKEQIEDRMATEAVAWLKTLDKDKPFFMNYWMFSVHGPWDAKEELVAKYRKRIAPKDGQRCAIYAAMIESMDDAVGTLLDAIDAAGVADDTIIVFTSDNGGNMYSDVEGETPTSNRPLRGGKASMFEGGVRVPTVVVWPGVTEPGSRSDVIIQSSDFYPTLLTGLGISLPKDHPIDGMDLAPVLSGNSLARDAIYTYFPAAPPVPDWLPPSVSVHAGSWKLIRIFHYGDNGAHDYRLYNLDEDIGETRNLAAEFPERVKTLDAMIEKHLQDTRAVVPAINPRFDPAQYRPELIGVGKLRTAKKANNAAKSKKPKPQTVAGWRSGGTCGIRKTASTLVINSTGGDPYISASSFKAANGPFTVSFRLKSTASGTCTVFYNKPSLKQTVNCPVEHDGAWHDYKVAIPGATLDGLRFDPATGKGRIEFDWIRLESQDGTVLKEWGF